MRTKGTKPALTRTVTAAGIIAVMLVLGTIWTGRNRPDAKGIPIIALTANAFDEDVQRSLLSGLNAHLSKPVEPETLFATLEQLIRH